MPQSHNPNPQGKGVVSVLAHINDMQPSHIKAKSPIAWWADYFTSVLILNATFSFQPKQNVDYYLYLKHDEWILSLIEPKSWTVSRGWVYFAVCQLNTDMTWTLTPKTDALQQPAILKALKTFQLQFGSSIDETASIESQLPFFIESLPFYRKLSATALAKSLQSSYQQTQTQQPVKDWYLPMNKGIFLLQSSAHSQAVDTTKKYANE
ncbi:hypothetical protein [Bermanella sp. R86510]|uniref:hypothetical protein n=1 Tax=unclassified Bermanella TaxID=2627862 RepID=UPI0037C8E90A